MSKVLVLGSNPVDTERVRIDWEAKQIEQRLDRGGSPFTLVKEFAVTTREIIPLIRRVEPQILHVSGHGTKDGSILFEKHDGSASHAVDIPTFARILTDLRVKIDCVVLNACFSAAAIDTLFNAVDAVVAMDKPISDEAAVSFSYGFYHALADRRSIGDAFTEARLLLLVEHKDESQIPQLKTRNNVDSRTLFVAPSNGTGENKAPQIQTDVPLEPELRAEFQRDKQSGKLKFRDSHYEIRLFVRNAAPDVSSVEYRLHPSFREAIRTVNRGDEPDFSEYITSYGDFKVVSVLKTATGQREISRWLSSALGEGHKQVGDIDSNEVRRALKRIEDH